MAEDDTTDRKEAGKDATERRVYNLPSSLLERLRAYQTSQGIPSETEAARRLLDTALQLRDNVHNLLAMLEQRYGDEKDLRVLAADILIKHALVKSVEVGDSNVSFTMRDGDRGMITSVGDIYFQDIDMQSDDWSQVVRPKPRSARSKGGNWDAPPASDLDDEIPF